MKHLVAATIALSVLATSPALGQEKQAPVETLKIGEKAPDFNLPGVDGKRHSLKDFANAKILVVLFTCNHCPTAQAYEERIKKIVSEYKPKGLALVGISPNDPQALRLDEMGYTDLGDSLEDMKIRAEHKQFNFPYLYDGDKQEAAGLYGPTATPHVFIFDSERKLRYGGRIDNAERESAVKTQDARNAIDALLEGKPVPAEQTRPFGCSIKWPDKRDSVKQAMAKLAAEEVALKKIDTAGVIALRKNDSEKLRLINLWATWCGPCVREFPELVTINRMYRHRPFEMITVSADLPDKDKEVLMFLKKHEASTANYLFSSEDRDELAKAIGKEWEGAIPYTLLIRPGGEVVYRHEGMIDPLEVKRLIVKHLGQR